MSIYDRRRVLVAALLTMVALPGLWWAKRDHPISTPAVASADAGGALGAATGASAAASNIVDAGSPPGYLSGPADTSRAAPGTPTGPAVDESFTRTGLASFRTFPPDSQRLCELPFLPGGTRITVENTDNGKRIECYVSRERVTKGTLMVLDASLFVELSDLAEAPIPVRIRW